MPEGSVVHKKKPQGLSKSVHKPTGKETTQKRRKKARSSSLLAAASDYKDVLRASARHYKESQGTKKLTTGSETKVIKSRILSRVRDPSSRRDEVPRRAVSDTGLLDSLSKSLHADTGRMEGKNRRASLSQASLMWGSRRSLVDNSRMEGNNRRASLSQSRRSLVESSHMWGSRRTLADSFTVMSFTTRGLSVVVQKPHQDVATHSDESQSFLTHAVEIRRRKHFQKCSKSATLIQRVARGWLVRCRHKRIEDGPKASKLTTAENKSKKGREMEKRCTSNTSRRTRPSLLSRGVNKTAATLETTLSIVQSLPPGDDLEEDLCNVFRSNIAHVTARARRRSCYGRIDGICV